VSESEENGRSTGTEELAQAFAQLRAEDRRAAPSFRDLVERGVRASERPRRFAWAARAAVAACALVGLALGLLLARPAREPVVEGVVAELSGWRSPTAFLLDTPGRELASALPRLGDFGYLVVDAHAGRPKAERAEPLKQRKERRP